MRVLTPLALLLTYGIVFAGASVGFSLLVFDDHPGQLYRVWHVVTYGFAPWAWDPGWWGGYPELQFYPPGFAYLGALVHAALLGAVSVDGVYQALVWVVYLAPGLTVFAFLTRALGDAWRALPGAFVALTLSAGVASGVEGGVHVGMVPARLGWALLPLVPLAMSCFARGDQTISVSGATLVAAIALLHPAHLPTAVVFVLLAAAVRPEHRGRRLAHASVLLALAAGVTAFWTLPLLFRLSSARALAWGALSVPAVPFAVALAAAALLAIRKSATPLERALAGWPWVTLGVVILDRVVLEPLGVRWLPAERVADGAWMTFVLAAGLVLGRALASLPPRARALAVGMAIVLVTLLSLPGGALCLWPARGVWPSYAMTATGLRLPMLWERLGAAPPGRVLFVRSGIPLVHGTAWYRPHTHITSLTPRASGRGIVNGTFTHPSLTAAYLYRGRLDGGAITTLVEKLDGHTLFGRPLRELADVLQSDVGERLGIGTVVALEDDAPELARLTESRAFGSTWLPPFVIYTRGQPLALPLVVETSRWTLATRAEAGAWVTACMTHYPLWRAEVDGQPRATRRGPAGDLEVRLDRRDETVTLVYAPGLPEMIGTGLSAASVIALAAIILRRRVVSGSGPSA